MDFEIIDPPLPGKMNKMSNIWTYVIDRLGDNFRNNPRKIIKALEMCKLGTQNKLARFYYTESKTK